MIRSPLQIPNFRRLWLGQTLLYGAEQFWLIALTWLVLQKTGSGLMLGIVLMAGTIPQVLFTLVGGAISDRTSPSRLVKLFAIADTIIAAIITALLAFDAVQISSLIVLSVMAGLADAFFDPAILAMPPRLVNKSLLRKANAWLESGEQITEIIGPALAGVAIGILGLTITFGFGTALFALGSLSICFVRLRKKTRSQPTFPRQQLRTEIAEGLRYVWGNSELRNMLLFVALLSFAASGPLIVGCAELVRVRFDENPSVFGYLEAAAGVGALLGAIAASKIDAIDNPKKTLIFLAYVLGLGSIVLGFVHREWLAYGVFGLIGFGNGMVDVIVLAWLQKQTVPQMQGRVMSLLIFAEIALVPFSQGVSGLLSEINLTLLFVAAGLTMLLTGIFNAFSQPIRSKGVSRNAPNNK